MPELPEVETVRRGLQPAMEGARFDKVEARRGDLRWPLPTDFVNRLKGKTCLGPRTPGQISARRPVVRRRADHASRHVRLVPSSARESAEDTPGRYHHERSDQLAHDHVIFHMSSGAIVTFNDPRRFGCMKIVPRDALDAEPLLRALGPEPLGNEFDAALLASACKSKKTSLKAALSDQRVVAGLGNIYVCEALSRALLSPKRMASTRRVEIGRTARARRAPRRSHQGRAQRCDQGRRLLAARPSADNRRTRPVPAPLPRL